MVLDQINGYNIVAGTGFYFEELTGYIVEFSDENYEWACNYETRIITVPFFDHPEHAETVRHETMHAKTFDYFKQKHVLVFMIFLIFRNPLFLGSLNEIVISILSKSMKGWFTKGNMLQFMLDMLVIAVVVLSVMVNPMFIITVLIFGFMLGRADYVILKDC